MAGGRECGDKAGSTDECTSTTHVDMSVEMQSLLSKDLDGQECQGTSNWLGGDDGSRQDWDDWRCLWKSEKIVGTTNIRHLT